jgi:hypothetical protein
VLLRAAWTDVRGPGVRAVGAYYMLVFFLLRYCFHTYQPYLEAARQETPLVLGTLFCGLNVLAALGSALVPWARRRFGERALLWAMPLALAGSLLTMACSVDWLGISLFFVHQLPFGMHWSLVHGLANHAIGAPARATVLSLLSFVARLAFAAAFPALGLLQQRHGVSVAYLVVGGAGLVGTCVIMARGAPRHDAATPTHGAA